MCILYELVEEYKFYPEPLEDQDLYFWLIITTKSIQSSHEGDSSKGLGKETPPDVNRIDQSIPGSTSWLLDKTPVLISVFDLTMTKTLVCTGGGGGSGSGGGAGGGSGIDSW